MSPSFDLGSPHRLGYTNSAVTRAAELRGNAGHLAALLAAPTSRAYVVAGEMIVLQRRGDTLDPHFTPPDAHALGPVGEIMRRLAGGASALAIAGRLRGRLGEFLTGVAFSDTGIEAPDPASLLRLARRYPERAAAPGHPIEPLNETSPVFHD